MPKTDIEVLSPPGTFKPTGPRSLGVRAGDFVFVAGMRGIDPNTTSWSKATRRGFGRLSPT